MAWTNIQTPNGSHEREALNMCPRKYKINIDNAKYGHHGNGNIHVNHKLHGLGTTNEKLESQNNDKGNLIIREGVKRNGD